MNITDNDFIELRVRAYSTRSADGRELIYCRHVDHIATVTDTETGERLGEIASSFGGNVSMERTNPRRVYIIPPSELWRAFLESIEDPRATDQIVNKGTE